MKNHIQYVIRECKDDGKAWYARAFVPWSGLCPWRVCHLPGQVSLERRTMRHSSETCHGTQTWRENRLGMRKHALGLESIVWFHWIPCKVSNLGHRYMFQEVWILFGDLGTWCINRMIAGNNSPKSVFRLYLLGMSSSYIVGILNLFTLHLSGDISIKPCLRLFLVIEGQNLSFIRIYHL